MWMAAPTLLASMVRSVSVRFGELVELVVHRRRVAGGGDAADDGDAERATELADGVVDGGADAGPGRGERRHDHLGRGGHGDAGAEAEQQQPDAGRQVGAAVDERGLHGDPAGGDQRAGGDGDAAAVHLGEVGAGAGAEHHADRGRDEREAGGERRVVEDELQVLGLQEHGAGHGEEQQGERDAAGGEAAVAEQRRCRASVRRGRISQPTNGDRRHGADGEGDQ